MLLFEHLVQRGFLKLDPMTGALAFNRDRLAKFPDVRRNRMEEFKWLLGEWTALNKVRATPTTPAHEVTYNYTYELSDDGTRICISGPGGRSLPHLTFDPFSQRWIMTFIETTYGILQSKGWKGDSIVFTGQVIMIGVDCDLRSTITRRRDDEVHILNEEQVDGKWVVIDEWENRKK